nr:LysR family transcriptional regulator [Paenibacillus sp. HW567]
MNIQKYLALVKTVEYGSFTKAAEALNYSQSGISRVNSNWNIFKCGYPLASEYHQRIPNKISPC